MEYTDQGLIDGTGASRVGADSRAHVEEEGHLTLWALPRRKGLEEATVEVENRTLSVLTQESLPSP